MDCGNTLVQMGPGAHTGPIWAQVASSRCPDLALQSQPVRWDLEIIEEGTPKPEGPEVGAKAGSCLSGSKVWY